MRDARPGAAAVTALAGQAWGTGAALSVGSIARFVAAFLAARALGASGFGQYVLATTLVGLVGVLSAAGLSPGVLPFLARARASGSDREVRAVAWTAVRTVLVLSVSAALALHALAGGLATWVFGDPGLAPVLRTFAGAIVPAALVEGTRSLLHGLGAVARQQWLERVLQVVVTCALLALGYRSDWGMGGVAAATYAGLLAASVGALLLLRRRLPPANGIAAPGGLARALLRRGWPLVGSSVLTFALVWTDVLLMGVFGASAEVGTYAACARLAAAALLVQEALGPSLLALAAERFVVGDSGGLDRVYRAAVGATLGPGLVLLSALFAWAPEWLALFGGEFAVGAPALRVLLAGKAVALLCGMAGRVYTVTGLERRHLANTAGLVGLNLALGCWWIPTHGMLGAAAATALSLSVIRVHQLLELGRLRGLRPFGRRVLPLVAGIPGLALLVRAGAGAADVHWVGGAAAFAVVAAAVVVRFR